MMNTLSPVAQKTAKFINYTNRNVFLTGKAGTGKTTFLKYILKHTNKKAVVVAPTGIAAINAGGVTIHSLFQLPFGAFLPQRPQNIANVGFKYNDPEMLIKHLQMNERKRAIINEMELLVIDEVSMLRADLLDAIDLVLRHVRRRKYLPFGGVQVLFIGDMLQLPPVVKNEEWAHLSAFYKSVYFFDALVLKESPLVYVELDKIYRQSDEHFIRVLNNLRNNAATLEDLKLLNSYHKPVTTFNNKKYITLTTHNYKADKINNELLENLSGKAQVYEAVITKEYPEYLFPVEANLKLKLGAQVMFVKNDPTGEQRYFNGKIGEIVSLKDGVWVKFDDADMPIQVELYKWENNRYVLNVNTNEIEEETIGTFEQYPLKLAWAITVHKSQGLTFERAELDIAEAFAPGQVYVALSRLKSLDGLVLSNPLQNNQLFADDKISEFTTQGASQTHDEEALKNDALKYLGEFIQKTFNYNWLHKNIEEHLATYNKSEQRSVKQKYASTVTDLLQQEVDLKKHAESFCNQALNIINNRQADFEKHLTQRIIDAANYFKPRLKEISSGILKLLTEVQEEEKINVFLEELLYIENIVFDLIKSLVRLEELGISFSGGDYKVGEHLMQSERIEKRIMLTNVLSQKKKAAKRTKTDVVVKEKVNKPIKPKKAKGKDVTFKLIKEGLSIPEIAKKQSLAVSTIEGHVAQLIALNELKANNFLGQNDIDTILEKATELNIYQLGALKEQFENKYSYFNLKVAIASLGER